MKNIALLNGSGLCLTVALWDGVSAWNPVAAGQCASTQDVTSLPHIGPGWRLESGSWSAPPAPAPAPDPNGFVTAVARSAVANATKLAAAKYLAALAAAVAAGNTALITALWQMVIQEAAISTADQSTVHALAVAHGIGGI